MVGGKFDEAAVKVDSKRRTCISHEFREELRGVVVPRKTRKGTLLSRAENRDFVDEFRRVMSSEPRRTGVPENPSAEEMKAIWKKDP